MMMLKAMVEPRIMSESKLVMSRVARRALMGIW